ncbi:MAG: ComF family protein [Chitinophagales bacterium]|nr:ComF family protein [Bacteroidota bacterium]MCB9044249.1 ComF family protein [Chitinophagales bacterium]
MPLSSLAADVRTYLHDLVSLVYPSLCVACQNRLLTGEQFICLPCLYDLPETQYEKHKDNIVTRILGGRFPFEDAAALYFFNKGLHVQHIMHALKYDGQTDLGIFLGKLMGQKLMDSPYFQQIDGIIPVPLHPKKLKERGYNQSEFLAKGISDIMNVPLLPEALQRSQYTSSQTRKTRVERWENVAEGFEVTNKTTLQHKHILVVDDVLTTGATLEAVVHPLVYKAQAKVSIACFALADG